MPRSGAPTHVIERGTTVQDKLVALMDVVFAFGGQVCARNW